VNDIEFSGDVFYRHIDAEGTIKCRTEGSNNQVWIYSMGAVINHGVVGDLVRASKNLVVVN
jgi:hypothetical protein